MKRRRDDQSLEIHPWLSGATLHERAERLAVPTFDWLSTPIEAITEGLAHVHIRSPRAEPKPTDPQ